MLGFPIRKSSDHSSVDSSPRLIAASYVLHRLLVPRHPPCALKNLATKMLASTVQFSNNNRNPHPTLPPTPARRLVQKQVKAQRRNKQQESRPTGPLPHARPLRTQQRTYSHSPTHNPFQLTPTKRWTTTTPQKEPPRSRRTRHCVINDRPN